MTSEERVWHAARFLHEAHRERTPYQPLPYEMSPRDISEAYDIQEAFHELLKPERGAIVGRLQSRPHHHRDAADGGVRTSRLGRHFHQRS